MAEPRFLPGKAKALQEPPHRGRMEALAKAGFADADQILAGAAEQQELVFRYSGIKCLPRPGALE